MSSSDSHPEDDLYAVSLPLVDTLSTLAGTDFKKKVKENCGWHEHNSTWERFPEDTKNLIGGKKSQMAEPLETSDSVFLYLLLNCIENHSTNKWICTKFVDNK